MAASWDELPRDDLTWASFMRSDFQSWEQELGRPYDWSTDEGSGLSASGGLVRGMVAAAGLELAAVAAIVSAVMIVHVLLRGVL